MSTLFPRWGQAQAGKQGRDAGMANVSAAQPEEWRVRARREIERFFASVPKGREFKGEDIRLFCLLGGVGEPDHPNAWGAVLGAALRRELKDGRIRFIGTAYSEAGKSHRHRYALYARTVS